MSLVVTVARVKEKCGLTGITYDSTITNLIAEFLPAIEFAIRPEHLADTGNLGLQAVLNLGATEIVGGELMQQIARAPDGSELVRIGDNEILQAEPAMWRAVFGLSERGWRRLRPFLRDDGYGFAGGVAGGTGLGEGSG